jgi:phage terminase large subunit-like protein
MICGESGILSISRPDFMPVYEGSVRRVRWPNGAIALCFSAEEPDRLRGLQHEAAWCDELCFWRRGQDVWDMLMFGMRLGPKPQTFISTTPKPSPLLRWLLQDPECIISRGSTYDNRANLSPSFFHKIITRYEGTRLGRQELEAEVLEDLAGALWTFGLLEELREKVSEDLSRARGQFNNTNKVPFHNLIPEMKRIVIAVDPSGTDKETGSQQGIIVCGEGKNGIFYVLGDHSCSETPAGWAATVVNGYFSYGCDMIVAEKNFGGQMVEAVIRNVNRNVPIRLVTASHGKHIRAEPVAALYEQRRVRHLGYFKELEEQMTNITHEGYKGPGSPDRVDALVWAMTELAFPKQKIGVMTGARY